MGNQQDEFSEPMHPPLVDDQKDVAILEQLLAEMRALRDSRSARLDQTARYGPDRAPEELQAGPLGRYGVHLPTCDRLARTAGTCPCGFTEALLVAAEDIARARRTSLTAQQIAERASEFFPGFTGQVDEHGVKLVPVKKGCVP